MLRRFTKGQLIVFSFLFILLIIIIIVVSKTINKASEPKEVLQNQNIDKNDFLIINGDYLTYLSIGQEYKEEGTKENSTISYYKNDRQISKIDTNSIGTYLVKYENSDNNLKSATRVVIVFDDKKPNLTVPSAVTITSSEALFYDVTDGVIATDNSGYVNFECKNTLSKMPKNYIIECEAIDKRGNTKKRNRLIKVVPGIEFEYSDQLTIKYPENKNYTYKYSLDNGKTFIDANKVETLNLDKGNVIALVMENEKYVMSETYLIK